MSSASGRDRRIGAAEQRVDRIGGRDVGREARELRALTDEELIAHVRTLALEVGDSKWSAEALDWVNRLEALRDGTRQDGKLPPSRNRSASSTR